MVYHSVLLNMSWNLHQRHKLLNASYGFKIDPECKLGMLRYEETFTAVKVDQARQIAAESVHQKLAPIYAGAVQIAPNSTIKKHGFCPKMNDITVKNIRFKICDDCKPAA